MTAGDRDAVAASLREVPLTRQEAADDDDVGEDDLSLSIDRTEIDVRPNASRLERMAGRVERIVGEPVLGSGGFHGQAQQGFHELPI
jgi:hypothetical protein